MIWNYLRKKLGIEEQEKYIRENMREIQRIREHVVEIREKPRRKIVRRIIKRDERFDDLDKRIQAFYEWGLKIHEAVCINRQVLEELSNLLGDHFNKLDRDSHKAPEQMGSDNLSSQAFLYDSPSPNHRSTENNRLLDASQTANEIYEGKKLWENATDAQRNIIKRMYDLGYPVSYKELAAEIGCSISTIKSHINSLKDKNFNFRVKIGPNNTKKYLLDRRVKNFLTLRLND